MSDKNFFELDAQANQPVTKTVTQEEEIAAKALTLLGDPNTPESEKYRQAFMEVNHGLSHLAKKSETVSPAEMKRQLEKVQAGFVSVAKEFVDQEVARKSEIQALEALLKAGKAEDFYRFDELATKSMLHDLMGHAAGFNSGNYKSTVNPDIRMPIVSPVAQKATLPLAVSDITAHPMEARLVAFAQTVIEKLMEKSQILPLFEEYNLGVATTLNVPLRYGNFTVKKRVEKQPLFETEAKNHGKIEMKAHELYGYVPYTTEILRLWPEIQGYLVSGISEYIQRYMSNYIIHGTGVDVAEGIVAPTDNNLNGLWFGTGVTTGTFMPADYHFIYDVYAKFNPLHQVNAVWFVNNETWWGTFRKYKDLMGRTYIDSNDMKLEGRPVYIVPDLDSPGSGTVPIVLIDPNVYKRTTNNVMYTRVYDQVMAPDYVLYHSRTAGGRPVNQDGIFRVQAGNANYGPLTRAQIIV